MLSVDKSGKGKIKLTIVTSGDSYSSTDFNPKKEQPSPTNPFGNPPLPESSSIDQKWIHYLTMTYNSSVIQTYNMANYGATMDGFVRFYHEHFMPHYGISNHTGAARWNATNSLFTTFFGINDVRRCTDQPLTKDDCSEIFESLFAIYAFLLEQVSNSPQTPLSRSIVKLLPPPALSHRRPQLPHPQHPAPGPDALLAQMGPPSPSPRRLGLERAPRLPRLQPDARTPGRDSLSVRHARPLHQSHRRSEILPANGDL